MLLRKNQMIDEDIAAIIERAKEWPVRSVLKCRTRVRRVRVVLRKEPCHRQLVEGEAVGIIAAQSIGERNAADHEDVPHRWRGRRRHHAGPARVEELFG